MVWGREGQREGTANSAQRCVCGPYSTYKCVDCCGRASGKFVASDTRLGEEGGGGQTTPIGPF